MHVLTVFGRYIKLLIYCTIYEKNFYLLFKFMLLNSFIYIHVDLKKIEAHFSATLPPLHLIYQPTQNFDNCSAPTFQVLKKL